MCRGATRQRKPHHHQSTKNETIENEVIQPNKSKWNEWIWIQYKRKWKVTQNRPKENNNNNKSLAVFLLHTFGCAFIWRISSIPSTEAMLYMRVVGFFFPFICHSVDFTIVSFSQCFFLYFSHSAWSCLFKNYKASFICCTNARKSG